MHKQDFKTLLQEKTLYKCFCRTGIGTDCPLHWHESYEICQVLSGSLKFLVDGVSYEISAGDIVCINAAVPHLTYDVDKGARLRVFKTLSSNLLQASVHINRLDPHISYQRITAVDGLEREINDLLDMLENRKNVALDENCPIEQSIACALYFLIADHFSVGDDEYKTKKTERKMFFKTLDYVNAHFSEPINASVLSKKLFYHRARLSAVFVKYSGVRLGDYINGLRIQNVNELLMKGTSVTDAALQSGFQTIRSFNNIYKETMGMTPTEFLRMQ